MTVTEQTTAQNSVQRTTSRDTGAPAWIDLSTRDIEGAKAFYAELFGWTFEDRGGEEFAHYQFILRDGEPIGGLMSTVGMTCPEGGQLPTEWGVYLTVTDIDAAARAVETTGGGVVVPAMPGRGRRLDGRGDRPRRRGDRAVAGRGLRGLRAVEPPGLAGVVRGDEPEPRRRHAVLP